MFSKNRRTVKQFTTSTANLLEFTSRRNLTLRLSNRCISSCTLDGRATTTDETRRPSASGLSTQPSTMAATASRLLSPMRFVDNDGRKQRRRRYSSDATTAATGRGGGRSDLVIQSDYGSVSVPDTNLPQFVWKDIDKWGDKPMVTCGVTGKSYTFEKGREACIKFANAVADELQMKKGDVIGLLLPNMPEYVIAIHGAIEAGVIVTFVNPLYTAEEVSRQFENARVKCCVTIPELLPLIEKIAPLLPNYTSTVVVDKQRAKITDPNLKIFDFEQLLASQPAKLNVRNNARIDDLAVLPYSSGTTGLPKGVMLTHANLAVNLEQFNHPSLSNYLRPTDAFQEVTLSVLPFFHIYGLNIILNNNIRLGMHIITMPKFTPDGYLQCLVKYKPTQLFLVPSLLLFLATHPAVKPEYLESVKEIVSGAAAATKSLIENFKTKFSDYNVNIRQGYGMTELSPCVFLTPLDAKPGKDGAAGKLIRGTSARVVNLKTGENQPPHESGELYIKGPQIMKGYWENEAATKEMIDQDGWLHTGDVAYYDEDGYFYIIDRTKELIKVKGNQVSPTELENIILKLPQVSDVAVIGVPDPLADEVPKAFIVLKPNAKLTAEEISNHVNSQVVNYKRLAGGIVFTEAIPRNAAGKILRKELKVLNGRIG